MKALPFPCIRPADDRLTDALATMGAILRDGDGMRDAIADGRLLKDPGAAYYLYEKSTDTGSQTAVLAICPASDVAKTVADASEDEPAVAATARNVATAADIQDLCVQPRATSLAYPDQPVMSIIIDAAKQGTAIYELTDATGAIHRFWEVKRKDAVDAIHAMFEQVDAIVSAGDDEQARTAVQAAETLSHQAKGNGSLTGKEPFNYVLSALWPASTVAGGAPIVPLGFIMHQVAKL